MSKKKVFPYRTVLTTAFNKPVFVKEFREFIKDTIEQKLDDHQVPYMLEIYDHDEVEMKVFLTKDQNLVDIIREVKDYTTFHMWQEFSSYMLKHYPLAGMLWDPHFKVLSA